MTVDELIRQYPLVSIEDGYSTPPQLTQSINESGAWVRASRVPKSDIWFIVNKNMNSQLIYPGNVILVDKNKNFTKNMVEIPFTSAERKVLRLDARYSNEVNDSSSRLSGFTRADVNAFVNKCLTNYKNGSHDLSSNTSWAFEQTERKEGITLGGTIKGVNFEASAGGRNKTVSVAYMKQIMYTVSLNNEYSRRPETITFRITRDGHALTAADFDFKAGTVKISKSYQRLHGEDVITTPKTKKSNRTIKMPPFLCEEIQDYLKMLYGLKKKDRIFTFSKSYLHHEMDRGAKAAGVKRIRIHDLRHSHVSLLIDMGFTPVAIADRLGHESIEVTLRYAHLFPSKQAEMIERLEKERMVEAGVS